MREARSRHNTTNRLGRVRSVRMLAGTFPGAPGNLSWDPDDLESWRCAMDMGLKYPRWQEPLAAAILEFNPQQLRGKLQKADEAITNRIQELTSENDNGHERRALLDGISIVQSVKRDRLGARERTV